METSVGADSESGTLLDKVHRGHRRGLPGVSSSQERVQVNVMPTEVKPNLHINPHGRTDPSLNPILTGTSRVVPGRVSGNLVKMGHLLPTAGPQRPAAGGNHPAQVTDGGRVYRKSLEGEAEVEVKKGGGAEVGVKTGEAEVGVKTGEAEVEVKTEAEVGVKKGAGVKREGEAEVGVTMERRAEKAPEVEIQREDVEVQAVRIKGPRVAPRIQV